MNGDTLGTLALALVCVLALSVTASAVQSAVSTSPDDAIDVDTGSMPVSQEDAANIERKVQGNSKGSTGGAEEQTDTDAASTDSEESAATQSGERQSADRGEVDASTARSDGDRSESGPRVAGGDSSEQQSGEGAGGSGGGGSSENGGDANSGGESHSDEGSSGRQYREASLLERLFSLLADLLDRLLSALPLLALLIVAALAVRFRDRILDRLRGSAGTRGGTGSGRTDRVTNPVPQHGVAEAWAELLTAIDRSRDPTASPAECAREAVRAGFDPDGVRTLRKVYEEVRYGDAAVTRERERAAWESLERSGIGRST
jgi:hypothetical protein